jgi:hypothetical protein
VQVEVHQNGWAVIRESNERATSVHPTQAEAAKEGLDIARRDEIEFFLHAQDGRIREHDSHREGEHPEMRRIERKPELSPADPRADHKECQDFYGESLGRINSQLQGNRSQMESLAEQIPDEEAQAQIQEMADSYAVIEESFDKAVQDLGVEDAVRARHYSRPSGWWLAKQR